MEKSKGKTMRKNVAIITCIAVLLLINYSIYSKEKHISEGQVILLKLVPVDPRSLMQGDYMALRFDIASVAYNAVEAAEPHLSHYELNYEGVLIVALDDNRVASFLRLDDERAIGEGEAKMQFRIRTGVVKFATNAYFFQEGHADLYEKAKYGEFKVNSNGELLLTALRDEKFVILGG